jgi:hypothetical protein
MRCGLNACPHFLHIPFSVSIFVEPSSGKAVFSLSTILIAVNFGKAAKYSEARSDGTLGPFPSIIAFTIAIGKSKKLRSISPVA